MSHGTLRLLLLRHGQTQGNVEGALDTGVPGLDLTDLGHAQARAAADALGAEQIDALYVSLLVRTHQTAAPIAHLRSLGHVVRPGLEEIGAGHHEMATHRDAVTAYRSTVAEWMRGNLDPRMPGGETGHEFLTRYDAAITDVAAAGHRSALVVSHGAAMRVWTANRITRHPGHPELTDTLDNTACITLEGHPGTGWRLLDWHSEPLGGHLLEDKAAPDPTSRPAR